MAKDLNHVLDHATTKKIEHASAEACHLRGFVLRRLANDQAGRTLARNELEQAVRLGRREPQLFEDLGAVLVLLKKPDEATAAYTQGLKLAPEHVQLRIKRGWATAEQEQTRQQAHEDFAAAVRSEPDNAEARVGLGYVLALEKSAKPAQAEAALALMNQNNDRILLRYVACVYARLAEWDEEQRTQHQDVAMTLLQKGVALWRAGGSLGPNEIRAIEGELALESLKTRPDFQQLISSP